MSAAIVREKPLVSIICPAYNEQENVRLFYERITAMTVPLSSRYDFEIIYMNNRSTDKMREIVLEIGADLLVRALGVARDAFEVRFDLGVVVDLEVVGRVDVPLEIGVADLVLAVVGDVRGLRQRVGDEPARHQQEHAHCPEFGARVWPLRKLPDRIAGL